MTGSFIALREIPKLSPFPWISLSLCGAHSAYGPNVNNKSVLTSTDNPASVYETGSVSHFIALRQPCTTACILNLGRTKTTHTHTVLDTVTHMTAIQLFRT